MSPRKLDKCDLRKRELELIDTALGIMKSDGTAGLTMDKVVARVPYSKGTVYNHFISKEDLLMGVCNASMSMLTGLFKRAVAFNGSPRERIFALLYSYLLHAQLHPDRFLLVISAKTPNLMDRSSDKRLEEHRQLEQDLMGSLTQLIETALANGELVLPKHMTVQQIAFANWSSSFGSIALLISHVEQCSGRAGLDVERDTLNNANLLLDGLNWKPLSTQHDYQKTLQRIATELYPKELTQLKAKNSGI